ncbi:hypothetical protein [Flavobacterium sp.]|jgi:hypothetical protein|uniref:hypothetical protein n=1 Tax=Flavobacterium sp. TaxID=239 RepID=UPI0037C0C90C
MPSVTYALDTSGVNPSNLVSGEIHTVSEAQFRDYYFIVPKFAPFFVDNFQLLSIRDGVEYVLTEDVDYSFALPYITGTRVTGKQMYGALTLHNQDLDGILSTRYQTVGGDQVCDRLYVLTYLADKAYNPRTTVWDVVTNVPNAFPPVPHYQDYDDFKGQESLVAILGEIRDAIATNSSLTTEKVEEFLAMFSGSNFSLYVKNTGDTVTGQLLLTQPPSAELAAVNKKYVDDNFVLMGTFNSTMGNYYTSVQTDNLLDQKLDKSGGELTGPLVLSGNPTGAMEPVNKSYLETLMTGVYDSLDGLTGQLQNVPINYATKAYVDQKFNELLAYLQGRKGR